MARLLRLALVQMHVTANKTANLSRAGNLVREAASGGANMVLLPECFNSPYGTQYFADYAETIPGETSEFLSKVSKEANVWLFGGSFPERSDDGKLRNTSLVFSPSGDLVARFSKVHLFDIDVPGKITFQESKILSAGSDLVTVDVGDCRVGLGICYDCRFPEMAQIYAQKGCHLLLYPGASNMTTGPLHWELLARSRANDNQMFVAFCSPARDTTASYVAWGHSIIVSPWGQILASAKDEETTIFADIDLKTIEEVRQQIPVRKQKRFDIYEGAKYLK